MLELDSAVECPQTRWDSSGWHQKGLDRPLGVRIYQARAAIAEHLSLSNSTSQQLRGSRPPLHRDPRYSMMLDARSRSRLYSSGWGLASRACQLCSCVTVSPYLRARRMQCSSGSRAFSPWREWRGWPLGKRFSACSVEIRRHWRRDGV